MYNERPALLKSGDPARLIPIVADTSREQRVASVLLASMTAIPEFANSLLSSAGRSVGRAAKTACWTEIVFKNQPQGLNHRPDGLVVVRSGGKEWTALVEAKIGNQEINPEQVEHYAELARQHDGPKTPL